MTLSDQAEAARVALAQLDSRAQTYERHVSTLLGYLDAAAQKGALSETAIVVCRAIARDTGSAAFQEAPHKK